jgi:hypothetical protein
MEKTIVLLSGFEPEYSSHTVPVAINLKYVQITYSTFGKLNGYSTITTNEKSPTKQSTMMADDEGVKKG